MRRPGTTYDGRGRCSGKYGDVAVECLANKAIVLVKVELFAENADERLTLDEGESALEMPDVLLLDDPVDKRPGVSVLTVTEVKILGVLLTELKLVYDIPLGTLDNKLDVMVNCEVVAKSDTLEEDRTVGLVDRE